MIKRRKKGDTHRQGMLIRLVDALQELIHLQYDKKLWIPHPANDNEDDPDSYIPNPKVFEKMLEILSEFREFDITDIKALYLTSGGRIVLDHGYGEYFNDGDKLLYTREELRSGIRYPEFMEKLREARGERR